MTLTILMMAGASALMALSPTFATIGVAAPILFVIGRSLQASLPAGSRHLGGLPGAKPEPGRRASAGMWQQVSVGAGTLSASLLASGDVRRALPGGPVGLGMAGSILIGAVLAWLGCP